MSTARSTSAELSVRAPRRRRPPGSLTGDGAADAVGGVGCPAPLLRGRPRPRRRRLEGGEADPRRGALARGRRPPGAVLRGARPQGRPRDHGARPRPRPAAGVPAGARRPRRCASSTRSCRSPSCRSTRTARTTSGRASRPRSTSRARRPRPSSRCGATASSTTRSSACTRACRRSGRCASTRCRSAATSTPTGTRCRSRSASSSWPATPASGAPTPAACCSSSPARPGIDDWEWGVTLLADDPVVLKEIVYEMRFDPVSAEYAEFGPFVTGLRRRRRPTSSRAWGSERDDRPPAAVRVVPRGARRAADDLRDREALRRRAQHPARQRRGALGLGDPRAPGHRRAPRAPRSPTSRGSAAP